MGGKFIFVGGIFVVCREFVFCFMGDKVIEGLNILG